MPHAFWNPGPEPALLVEYIVPGGFAAYFRELVALARESGGPPDRTKMAEIQLRYGLEMDMESIGRLSERYRLRPPRL